MNIEKRFRIAIDARMITNKVVGISRYTLQLIIGIISQKNIFQVYCIVNTHDLEDELIRLNLYSKVKILYLKSKPISIFEHIEIPLVLLKNNIKLFHVTSYIAPLWIPCKFVYNILDTYHLLFPGGFHPIAQIYFNLVVKSAAKNATRIVTISKSSKEDIQKYVYPTNNINITYLSVEDKFYSPVKSMKILKKYDINNSGYFLYIGNHRVHKNWERVLLAYKGLVKLNDGIVPDLVLNLPIIDGMYRIIDDDFPINKCHFLSFIDDNDLPIIYAFALALVSPSLCEGFGLFLLEAMATEIPIITSNVSSMPEIVDDAALLVDPFSIDQIQNAMKKIMTDEKLRTELIKKGRKRLRYFSWRRCTEETLNIYYQVLGLKRMSSENSTCS